MIGVDIIIKQSTYLGEEYNMGLFVLQQNSHAHFFAKPTKENTKGPLFWFGGLQILSRYQKYLFT